MTQKEKELLFKDITSRLPYQPMCEFTDTEDDFCKTTGKLGYSLRDFVAGKVIIKPYLRPMSSMTDEEFKTYEYFLDEDGLIDCSVDVYVDWLLEGYFDFRGLIPKGLALEAPEGMYVIK